MLQSMELQSVGHFLVTEQQQSFIEYLLCARLFIHGSSLNTLDNSEKKPVLLLSIPPERWETEAQIGYADNSGHIKDLKPASGSEYLHPLPWPGGHTDHLGDRGLKTPAKALVLPPGSPVPYPHLYIFLLFVGSGVFSTWQNGLGTKLRGKRASKRSVIEPILVCPLPLTSFVPTMSLLNGSAGKNPPAMQETWVQSLGREDPLEKEMATHSSILAWEIPWTEEPGKLQSMGWKSQTRLK